MIRSASEAVRSPYDLHRAYVLAVLARRCGWLDAGEREEVLHDAYAVMLEKQRDGALAVAAMRPQQVRAYLVQTALNKALDERKRARRTRDQPLDDALLAVPDAAATPEELAATNLDSARVREIVAELSERQQTIIKLRFFFDRTPEEIQRFMGLTERVYRRELERAVKAVAERYELVREGTFCDSRRSVILAFVAGVAGPGRIAEARRHLATCTGCARWAAELHAATRKAAAFVPGPLVALGGHGRWVGIQDRLAELAGTLKQHGAALTTRVDPSAGYLTGARPGAVGALVAGCVAVGGGATYCAVDGLPGPLGGPHHHAVHGAAPKVTRAAAAPPRAVTTPAATTATAAAPAKSRTRTVTTRRTTTTKAKAAAARRRRQAQTVNHEFGFEQQSRTTAVAPAPAPAVSAQAAATGRNVAREFGP